VIASGTLPFFNYVPNLAAAATLDDKQRDALERRARATRRRTLLRRLSGATAGSVRRSVSGDADVGAANYMPRGFLRAHGAALTAAEAACARHRAALRDELLLGAANKLGAEERGAADERALRAAAGHGCARSAAPSSSRTSPTTAWPPLPASSSVRRPR
jgi:hypothetical protein